MQEGEQEGEQAGKPCVEGGHAGLQHAGREGFGVGWRVYLGFRTGPAAREAAAGRRRTCAGTLPNPLWASCKCCVLPWEGQPNDSRWLPVVCARRRSRQSEADAGRARGSLPQASSPRPFSPPLVPKALPKQHSQPTAKPRQQAPTTRPAPSPPPASSTYTSTYTAQATRPGSMHSCRPSTTPPASSRDVSCCVRTAAASLGRPGRASAEHSGAISTCSREGGAGGVSRGVSEGRPGHAAQMRTAQQVPLLLVGTPAAALSPPQKAARQLPRCRRGTRQRPRCSTLDPPRPTSPPAASGGRGRGCQQARA